MDEKAPPVLQVIAVARPEPPRVVRARVEAEPAPTISIGGGANDSVRLAGAERSAAELVVKDGRWYVRLSRGALDAVSDGMRVSIDAWDVYVFADEQRDDSAGGAVDARELDQALASLGSEADRPRLEFEDDPPLLLDSAQLVLLGNLPDSDYPLTGAGAGCAIAVRTCGTGGTYLYWIKATEVLKNGTRAARRSRLADRDRVAVALGAGRANFVFRDPQEVLDRLLGQLRGDTCLPEPPMAPPDPAWRSIARRALARMPKSPVTRWEAGLWAAGASVAAAYALLVVARC